MTRWTAKLADALASARGRFADAASRGPQPAPHGWRAIEVSLAGVLYHGQGKPALGLRLRDPVLLKCQPENPHDANAVVVLDRRGRSVGHVPRDLAQHITQGLRSGRVGSAGLITGLRSDPTGKALGVTIAVDVVRDLGLLVPASLEFALEESAAGSVYLLLNCDSALLNEVQESLTKRSIGCERVGQAFRPASDGNVYQWYVRMAEGVTTGTVEAHFAELYGLSPWKPQSSEELSDYAEAFDSEIAAKDARIADLEDRIRQAAGETREARQRLRKAGAESLRGLVEALLPQVKLLRDSWDVLSKEIAEPEDALREIHAICCSVDGVPAKTVQGALGWKELRFKTGQKDNGRLYFRRDGASVSVLVSFKALQEKDIRYLKAQ